MTTVLITGGAGNLGRQIAVKLAERGHQVRVFDLPDLDYSFAEDHDTIEVVTGDIREELGLTGACEGIECVVHLAAISTTTPQPS